MESQTVETPVVETPPAAPAPETTKSGLPMRERTRKSAAVPPTSSLQSAYAEAKAQQSKDAAAPAVESPAEPPVVTSSQSKAPEPDATLPAPEPTTFLTDEEFTALHAEHQDDPAAFRKALDKRFNKALTTSTQKLSALRKSLEPYVEVLDGLESDDPAVKAQTVQALAQQYGVTLTPPAASTTPAETSADALTIAREALGPELEFLADKLAPAIDRILDRKLATTFEPVKARLHEQDQRTAQEEVSRSMQTFAAKHPDWQQHEERMTALAQQFPPAGTVSELEWMESLYKLATYDTAIAQGTQQAIQRMTKAAKTSETSRPAVHESHVHPVAPRGAGFRNAYEAAKRGEVWR